VWHANWIWSKDQGKNTYTLFRKEFQLPQNISQGTLRILADSRYVLYLNGERLGQGPARSWPQSREYDLYDVGGKLKEGTNVLAVMVHYYGISTFQYLCSPAGLLCQLDWQSAQEQGTIATDSSWRVKRSRAFDSLTPRISCQLPYSEVYDASQEETGWLEPLFDGSHWEGPVLASDKDRRPEDLKQRSIEFLTEEPVYPAYIPQCSITRPKARFWTVDVREIFIPEDRTANRFEIPGLLLGIIHAPRGGKTRFWYFSDFGTPYLNGKELERTRKLGALGDSATAELVPGENILATDLTGFMWHTPSVTVGLEDGLTLHSPLGEGEPFAAFEGDEGPILALDKAEALAPYLSSLRPLPEFANRSIDVAALTSTAEKVSGQVCVENLEHLGLSTAAPTVIQPSSQGDIEVLIDFGKELVGFLEFELEGPEGVILDWNFFEGIQEGKRIYAQSMKNTLRYITSGRSLESFHSLQRRGFRYVSLTIRNLTAPLKIHNVRCLLNTYPVTERGQFHCSDYLLNRIWEMCAYTTRLCMEDAFVDCPTYEQTFWVGDSRNEALINYYTFGELAMPKRCWHLVAESLKRSKLPESQVPSGWQDVIPAWSLLWVMACEEYYLYSGDRAFLQEIYPALAKTCTNFLTYINSQGLFEIEAWNLMDWAPMDTPDSGVVTHQNAWLVEALRRTAKVAQLLGEKEDEARFLLEAEKLIFAINEHLWSEENQAFIDCIHADGTRSDVISQQTNTVVYLCSAATMERQKIIAEYVKDVPAHWTRVGSPFMSFFVFEGLARQGEFQRILDQTRQGWGMMLERGSTTCWEMFPGFMEGLWSRSLCHAWSGGPAYFLSRYQLGVQPLSPGFTKVRIAPEPGDLAWCKGRVPTPQGEIGVAWKKEADGFNLEVKLPQGTCGEVKLPVASKAYKVDYYSCGELSEQDGSWHLTLPEGASLRVYARKVN
jgi:alpha-L-rhamnosidase